MTIMLSQSLVNFKRKTMYRVQSGDLRRSVEGNLGNKGMLNSGLGYQGGIPKRRHASFRNGSRCMKSEAFANWMPFFTKKHLKIMNKN